MAQQIKKATFDELYETYDIMCKNIDALLLTAKRNLKPCIKIWHGHPNFKDFLLHIETEAIKKTAVETNLSDTAVRDRWKIMSMPQPVYEALEAGEVTLSKLKPMSSINFDFNNEKDIESAKRLVDAIKQNMPPDELKELIKKEAISCWNPKDIVMIRLAEQNNITEKTIG